MRKHFDLKVGTKGIMDPTRAKAGRSTISGTDGQPDICFGGPVKTYNDPSVVFNKGDIERLKTL